MPFRFDHPAYLALLLLAAPVAWWGWRTLNTLEPLRRGVAVGLRVLVLTLLVLVLAGVQTRREQQQEQVFGVVEAEGQRRVAKWTSGQVAK